MKLKLIYSAILAACLVSSNAYAQPDFNKLADVIYKVENSKKFPYGILKRYRKTSPRQACLNTLKLQWKRHRKHHCGKSYLACLAQRYAPLNASNDPHNLNSNWLINVRSLYAAS